MQGFRTYFVAALAAIFGALATADWNAFLDDPKAGVAVVAMSALMAFMRSITSTPPLQK